MSCGQCRAPHQCLAGYQGGVPAVQSPTHKDGMSAAWLEEPRRGRRQQRSFGIAKERAAAMQRASAKVSRRACPGAPPTNPIDLPCGRIREGEDEHE